MFKSFEECIQINAVILQFTLSGLLSAVMGAGSVIWENDDWSFLKQSIMHFIITSITMFPLPTFHTGRNTHLLEL
ncbi:DUF3021 domain-containing protein [Clostridium sp. HV4-5-A1G]|nr:DUF3021 domain-containing protein [Clostridium sp. HV4-5-A1G]